MKKEDKIIGPQLAKTLSKIGYYSEKDKYVWIKKEGKREWILKQIDSLEVLSSKQMLLAPTLETARRWIRNTLKIFPIIGKILYYPKSGGKLGGWNIDICELKGSKRNKWTGLTWTIDEAGENTKKRAYEMGIRKSIEEYHRRILDEKLYTL